MIVTRAGKTAIVVIVVGFRMAIMVGNFMILIIVVWCLVHVVVIDKVMDDDESVNKKAREHRILGSIVTSWRDILPNKQCHRCSSA